MPKGARGINAVSISQDGSLVACVDLANEHNVYVFDVASGSMVCKAAGDTEKIFDIAFSATNGDGSFATAGSKHFYFWDASQPGGGKKKALFDGLEATSFSCVAWDADGKAYGGGANAKIYIFDKAERKCVGTIDAHKDGFICALTYVDGKLFSGGKDGQVCCIDTASMQVTKTWDFNNLVRAIDFKDGNLLVGLRNGSIMECAGAGSPREIMHSHFDGEVWGLDVSQYPSIYTSCDDNQVCCWDASNRKI